MDVEVTGSDPYACPAYKVLFETIMNDVGKAVLIEKAKLVLKPEIPLFLFSVKLVNEPVSKTISDVASTRQEGNETHLSISDEKYAPEILSQLWKNYGRDNVDQQTRFDLVVTGGDEDKIKDLLVSSGEEARKEIIGALWYQMADAHTGVCWECGRADCRLYSDWGLLYTDKTEKPAFFAMSEAIKIITAYK